MSKHGETTLVLHLVEPASLRTIAQEGLDPDVLPTEDFRPILEWAIDYFHEGGRTEAPSAAAMRSHFGDVLDEHEIDFEEAPEDTIEWALDDLKGSHIHKRGQDFVKEFALSLAEAQPHEKIAVVNEYAGHLMAMGLQVEDRSQHTDIREAHAVALHRYDERTQNQDEISGLMFGIPEIDNYTRGIKASELAIFAAGPKMGKSYFLASVAMHEWRNGRVPALYTLENSVEMTVDRIVCRMHGIAYRDWLHGKCDDDERGLVEDALKSIKDEDRPLWILQPGLDKRTVPHLVRDAALRGADSIIIDQLTHLDLPDPRKPRQERIGMALHTLHDLIGTGRDRMACLLAHQINREGVRAADKLGYLVMEHMAESAEVERTGDWVFGGHASFDEKAARRAKLQVLAARREAVKSWDMHWSLDVGQFSVIQERTGGR